MKEAIQEFKKYTDSYLSYGELIDLKINHTKRVTDIATEVAKSIKLSKKEIELATLCGLLHDIGRFEQYKRYQTYSDKNSVDHGDLGYKILKDKDYISVYLTDDNDKRTVLRAVKYHNKYSVPKNISKQDKLFCNITRDADKIDILYLYAIGEIGVESDHTKFTKETLDTLKAKKCISHKMVKNKADRFGLFLGFVFDLNFKYSFQVLKENNYINRMIDNEKKKFANKEFDKQLEEIRIILNEYIEEMISC